MKIALIGFMGAGKTTVGRLLAEFLNLPFIEMDSYIVKISPFSSIPEIFKEKGEIYFRELEIKAGKELSRKKGIVSTGGGVVENKIIIDYFRSAGYRFIYLSADFETLKKRVLKEGGRPLFEDVVKAKKLFTERLPLYKRYADIEIKTDDLSPEKIVDRIVKKLNLKVLV